MSTYISITLSDNTEINRKCSLNAREELGIAIASTILGNNETKFYGIFNSPDLYIPSQPINIGYNEFIYK